MQAMNNPNYAAIISAAMALLMEKTKTTEFEFCTSDPMPDKVMIVEHDKDEGRIKITSRDRQWGDEV